MCLMYKKCRDISEATFDIFCMLTLYISPWNYWFRSKLILDLHTFLKKSVEFGMSFLLILKENHIHCTCIFWKICEN